MQRRKLGNSALEVSAIGLGCMPLSSNYGPADDQESLATLHRALDLGITFLDTANIYGDGHNERLVGQAIAGRRDEAVLASKFGQVLKSDRPARVDGRSEYVSRACDASLQRLGVETIDLYYLHRVDPEVPIEETVGAMAALAWLLARGNDLVPIPGTRKRAHLEDNAEAVDLVLSADELATLDEAYARGAAAGARYRPAALARVNL
jgi:aryl-alcohol dehydrogenase-like predicted oxidoreductase